jgi:hypothetical protein
MAWSRSQRMSSKSSKKGKIKVLADQWEGKRLNAPSDAYDVDHNGEDEKGNPYVAAKGIAVYSPEGRPIHVMEMKELPSNCAFGEADNKSFFITARGLVNRVRLDVKGATPY